MLRQNRTNPTRRICVVLLLFTCTLPLTSCRDAIQGLQSPSSGWSDESDEGLPPSGKRVIEPGSPEVTGYDAIVVGSGISGLCTALELARSHVHVCLIEMSSVYGGHAVMSQGAVSIVGTPVQAAKGIVDSPELAYQDFVRFGEDAEPEWVKYYVENSRAEIFDWITDLGVRFDELSSSPGNSVEREHQPSGRGLGLVTPIYRECLEHHNLVFVWNTKVESLVIRDSRVTGVMGRNLRTGQTHHFAAKHIVLATGGFQSNLEMVREFWPAEFRFPDRILVGSGRNSVGQGHRLAETAGGELVKMDHQWNYFTGIPDPRYPGTNRGLSAANMFGMIVNSEGQQFANLWGWAKEVMPKLLAQKQATLWFVFDEATKPKFVVSGSDWVDFKKVDAQILQNPELVKSAGTLEELAKKTGLPSENLVETVRRYNELVDKGNDDDFQRFGPGRPAYANNASPRLSTPPYYAMQAFPLTRKSMGGVAINLECQVLDHRQQPIPGLYAVGELTGLGGINGKAALEGTFLGPCIVTGRVAARSILTDLKQASNSSFHDSVRCSSCHDLAADLAKSRPSYWHFEHVHRIVIERNTDCRQCHAELTPFRKEGHRINPQAIANSCVNCHVARE
ncbi:FAD-dependent oxidoreductase [Schlesneria paludicola]|uniref:FAD-dependent oxidoreductase n=1 Tax=Schlesneria paludicola TaxID=360056 RepID=UPI00029B23B7|nr:FAD-dependent oxidoreductase [Schlesneria paludicola]